MLKHFQFQVLLLRAQQMVPQVRNEIAEQVDFLPASEGSKKFCF